MKINGHLAVQLITEKVIQKDSLINMGKISLRELSEEDEMIISLIKNKTIQKMYGSFNFFFLELKNDETEKDTDNAEEEDLYEIFMFSYLKYFKFITYQVFDDHSYETKKDQLNSNGDININNSRTEKKFNFQFVVCVENECLIVNEISETSINAIISKLKENEISMINVSKKYKKELKNDEEIKVETEINNFLKNEPIRTEIKNNKFILSTLMPIISYMIRRFFYPIDYFKDLEFFMFPKTNESREEFRIKTKLCTFLNDSHITNINKNEEKLTEISKEIMMNSLKSHFNYNIFVEKEFILLREIYRNKMAIYYIVLHKETLFIFMMKKFIDKEMKENVCEIDFCMNFSHRCLNIFYGFLTIKDKEDEEKLKTKNITGLIYEYATKQSLCSYISSKQSKFNEMMTMTTLSRIFQGLDYLHSNLLIYRDLKPENIIVNHDNLAYISDFPTICKQKNEDENVCYTGDLGNQPYMSPEQYYGLYISSSHDIYSFGMIIYYLFEKKNFSESFNYSNLEKEIPKITQASSNIQNLFQSCIIRDPKKRIKNEIIRNLIIDENKLIYDKLFDTTFNINNIRINKCEIINFIYECIVIHNKNSNKLKSLIRSICNTKNNFNLLFSADTKQLISLSELVYDYKNVFLHDIKKRINSDENIDKILKYYSYSEFKNDKEAQCKLGDIFLQNKYISHNIEISIHYFTLSAIQNDLSSQISLAMIYFQGKYISPDINKAIYYFSRAADNNEPNSQSLLGFIYLDNNDVPTNINKSIYYFTLAANQNDSLSQHALGRIYYDGVYIPRDVNKAIYYFTLAAEQNNVKSQLNLGIIYYSNEYFPRDIKKAIHYFSLGAKQNDRTSQYLLGYIYYENKYVPRDINKSMKFLELAANQNDKYAQNLLGIIYYEGQFTQKNIKKSIFYLLASANQKYSIAQCNLGSILYEGANIQTDLDKAIHYLTLAANQNLSIAQCRLGLIYLNGKYIKTDINKAIMYLTLSARQNNLIATNTLGLIYYNGKYVVQDISKSIQFFTIAADQNHVDSLLNLGYIYYSGQYISKDIKKAIYYYELAAKHNSSHALFMLGAIYYEKEYFSQSIQYLLQAANLNHSYAQLLLGIIYYDNKYIQQDVQKSIYYLTPSSYTNEYSRLVLGYIYLDNKRVRNIKKGIEYIQHCAQNQIRDAQLILADLYFEGKHLKYDIQKAYGLYKEVSSFYNQYAKNNLGVIFKMGINNNKRINSSIEYFNEAIKEKNDKLAMFNLSNILLDEKDSRTDSFQYLNESIKLLIKSSRLFLPSKKLLCFLLIKKHKSITYEIIENELMEHNEESTDLVKEIYDYCIQIQSSMACNVKFQKEYQNLRETNFVYILYESRSIKDIEVQRLNQEKNQNKLKNINECFYEGFNIDTKSLLNEPGF